MPTIISHASIPLILAATMGRTRISYSVAAVGVGLAMLPDADVVGFRFGIAYHDSWGHRGATHSLAIAAAVAALVVLWPRQKATLPILAFLFVSMASHGLLDMLTNGGLGVALFWPWSDVRLFAPDRPIMVSPIGSAFFSARGLATLASELIWIWLPAFAILLLNRARNPKRRR